MRVRVRNNIGVKSQSKRKMKRRVDPFDILLRSLSSLCCCRCSTGFPTSNANMDAIIPPCLAIVPKRTLASIFQSTSQPLPDGLDSIDDDDQQQITVALRSSSWSPSTAQQAVLTFRAPRRIRMLANSDATTSVSIQKSQFSTDPTAEPPLKRPKLGKAPKSPLAVTSSHGYSEWERAVLAIMRETRVSRSVWR